MMLYAIIGIVVLFLIVLALAFSARLVRNFKADKIEHEITERRKARFAWRQWRLEQILKKRKERRGDGSPPENHPSP